MRTVRTEEDFALLLDEEMFTPEQGAAALSKNQLTSWCAEFAGQFPANVQMQQVDMLLDGVAPYTPETHDLLRAHFSRVVESLRGHDTIALWVSHSDDPPALANYVWQLNDAATYEEALSVPMPKHATAR